MRCRPVELPDQQHRKPGRKHNGDQPFMDENRHPDRIFNRCPIGKDQNRNHQGEKRDGGAKRLFGIRGGKATRRCFGPCGFFAAIDQMHDHADHNGKSNCADTACDADFRTKNFGRDHNGNDVDRRTGIEKGNGRAQTGPAFVNATKQGQYRAGTHREKRPRDRGNTQGNRPGCIGAKILHDRSLTDINRHRTGNDKGR